MNTKKNIALITMFLISISTGFAQANFSGAWTQTSKEQLSGLDYANAVPKEIKVSQYIDSLVIVKTSIGEGQDIVQKETLNLKQATAGVSMVGKQKKTSTLKWDIASNSFVQTASYTDQSGNAIRQIIDEWNLSNKGTILTITRYLQSATDPNDKWSVKATYQKH